MIDEATSVPRGATLECDVCIVGSGPAGLTIAHELAGGALDVVLLESGGRAPEPETQSLYEGERTGAPQFPLQASRLRYFGGTSNHWGGICRPLDAADMAARAWVPGSGWPLDRAALDPYYARAHPVLDLGPYAYDGESWASDEWGNLLDPGPELADRGLVRLASQQNVRPTRFGRKFSAALARAANVRVLLHANLFELVPHHDVKRVETARVRGLDGHAFQVRARRFVLACGAIENARLLLASDSLARDGLGNERDLVGRYFMDNPQVKPFGLWAFFDERGDRLAHKTRRDDVLAWTALMLSEELQRERNLLRTGLYMPPVVTPLATTAKKLGQVREVLTEGNRRVEMPAPHGARDLEDIDPKLFEMLSALRGEAVQPRFGLCWLECEQAPNPDSRVALADARDALGMRRVRLDWQLGELDRHSLRETVRLLPRLVGSAGAGRMKLVSWLDSGALEPGAAGEAPVGDAPGWWGRIFAGWHHCGTTRMADDASRGVVDRDCRVFGLSNLYVAGSSVFPTSGWQSPTLTIVALAIRLADHLASSAADSSAGTAPTPSARSAASDAEPSGASPQEEA